MKLDEIALSDDLKIIEKEINHHKNIAGQSIWEIGRRLNHVKENELVHGEFRKWHESLGIDKDFASKSMRVAIELPNVETFRHLGATALSLIATLPEEERNKGHITEKGESKTPDEMTVRELQGLKKQLKNKEKQIENLKWDNAQKDEEIAATRNEQKVVEKEIEITVLPEDYEYLKERNEFVENQLKELIDERKEVEEKSAKYDALSNSINELQGKMNSYQKEILAYKGISETIRIINNLLDEAAGLIYLDDLEITNSNSYVREQLLRVLNRVDTWSIDLHKKLDKTSVLEGEFENE